MFVAEWSDAPHSSVEEYTFVRQEEPDEVTDVGAIIATEENERRRYEHVPFGWYAYLNNTDQWERFWPAAIGDLVITDNDAVSVTVDICAELRTDVTVSIQRCLAASNPEVIEESLPYGIAVETVGVHQRLTEENAVRFVREQTGVTTTEIHEGQDALTDTIHPNVCREIARIDRNTKATQFPLATEQNI